MSKNIATLKSRSRVREGHRKWYHSTDCIRFPIRGRGTSTHTLLRILWTWVKSVSCCTVIVLLCCKFCSYGSKNESIVDRTQNKWRGRRQMWWIERQKDKSRRRRLWETKNSVLGLVTEDGGSYYWMWRTKDFVTRQIKLGSMKMEASQGQREVKESTVLHSLNERVYYIPVTLSQEITLTFDIHIRLIAKQWSPLYTGVWRPLPCNPGLQHDLIHSDCCYSPCRLLLHWRSRQLFLWRHVLFA